MHNKPIIIVIFGPTGIGKSSYAITLARKLSAPIVCADSRQIYKGLRIGAASPTEDERQQAEHLLYNSIPLDQPITVNDYVLKVQEIINNYEGEYLILCGGTGFYIDALLYGMDELPDISLQVKTKVYKLEQKGLEHLQKALKDLDPDAYKRIDHKNPRRLTRALELILGTGKSLSKIWSEDKEKKPLYRHIPIYIHMDREDLYNRINKRVDLMLEQGIEEEAKSLYSQKHLKSLNTVGYSEFFSYFDGKIDYEEAVRLIKRNSRRYAKRQMTWYRRSQKKWNAIAKKDLENFLTWEQLEELGVRGK